MSETECKAYLLEVAEQRTAALFRAHTTNLQLRRQLEDRGIFFPRYVSTQIRTFKPPAGDPKRRAKAL